MEIYIILFTVFMCLRRVVPFCLFINRLTGNETTIGPVTSGLFAVFIAIGVIFLLHDLFTNRNCLKTGHNKVLLAFLAVLVLSCIVNIHYGFLGNVASVINACVEYLLFYTLYIRFGKEHFLKFFKKLFQVLIPIWFVCVVISIVQFITLQDYEYILEGVRRCQGFSSQRLFGVFIDPNYAAVTSLVLILGAFYCYRTSGKFARIFYIISAVSNYIYAILSLSRTGDICLYVATFLLGFYLGRNRFKKFVFSFAIGLASVIMVFLVSEITTTGLKLLPKAYESVFHIEKEDPEEDVITLDRQDVESDNISNNRISIWSCYLNALKKHMVLGLSPENALKHVKAEMPDSYVSQTNYVVHNGYLKVLVSTGVIGAAIMLFFLALSAKDIASRVMATKELEHEYIALLIILIILAIFGFFFNELFLIQNMTTILVWPILGYLTASRKDAKIDNEQQDVIA